MNQGRLTTQLSSGYSTFQKLGVDDLSLKSTSIMGVTIEEPKDELKM